MGLTSFFPRTSRPANESVNCVFAILHLLIKKDDRVNSSSFFSSNLSKQILFDCGATGINFVDPGRVVPTNKKKKSPKRALFFIPLTLHSSELDSGFRT